MSTFARHCYVNLQFLNNRNLDKRLGAFSGKMARIPIESYVATVLAAAVIRRQSRLKQMCYTLWLEKHSALPLPKIISMLTSATGSSRSYMDEC